MRFPVGFGGVAPGNSLSVRSRLTDRFRLQVCLRSLIDPGSINCAGFRSFRVVLRSFDRGQSSRICGGQFGETVAGGCGRYRALSKYLRERDFSMEGGERVSSGQQKKERFTTSMFQHAACHCHRRTVLRVTLASFRCLRVASRVIACVLVSACPVRS